MNNTISVEQDRILNQLLAEVMSLHSFEYSTLAEARKTVCYGNIEYCFDALSLCIYHSNLNQQFSSIFSRKMSKYYRDNTNRETQKERDERTTLFQYLIKDSCPYRDYRIVKEIRPDFVLEGDGKRIGIEIVELTTPHDQVLFSISKEHFGQGKTAIEIKDAAIQKHGEKAREYEYWDIEGSACIGAGVFNTWEKQKLFTTQLYEKFKKYESMISSFDRFIIIGDALRAADITISDNDDVRNIFEWLEVAPDLSNVSFVILWQENGSSGYSVSQFDI